jgi:endo-alpha-1,4-polygalactosaminidase (GH114 family)
VSIDSYNWYWEKNGRQKSKQDRQDMVNKSKKYSKIVNKMPLVGINVGSLERKKSVE